MSGAGVRGEREDRGRAWGAEGSRSITRLRHLAAAERALVPAALRHGSIAALPTERGAPETRTCVLPAAAPALPRPRSQVWAYGRAAMTTPHPRRVE
ncbi:hypothetical protein E2C01_050446 [Portunus trituberculatus]|uniref:Uncharacterized protein n=1 Tax=Portunus trituberculatus TaxID=210409 RepID=A0A5B7GGT4_PORTR|nr:hypothetical protein [Portunus trituberculatus]